MKLYKIKEGKHSASPSTFLNFRYKPSVFKGLVKFTDASYDLGDKDQKDWNKLTGLSFHLFTNHKNSVMIGWRYNLKTKRIEINSYNHINGKTIYTKPLDSLNPETEKLEFEFMIDYSTDTVKLMMYIREIDQVRIAGQETINFTKLKCITREINVYFGGNEKASKDIYIKKQTV